MEEKTKAERLVEKHESGETLSREEFDELPKWAKSRVMGYESMCENCNSLDTLWPKFRGNRKFYECSECGEIAKGVKPTKESLVVE